MPPRQEITHDTEQEQKSRDKKTKQIID